MPGNDDIPRRLMEAQQQEALVAQVRQILRNVPSGVAPVFCQGFNGAVTLTPEGPVVILTGLRQGAVMADGTFRADVLAPVAAVQVPLPVVEQLRKMLGQLLDQVQGGEPPGTAAERPGPKLVQ